MAPTKGKQPTKGARQIVLDNTAAINFYRSMSLAAFILYSTITILFYYEALTFWYIVLNCFVGAIYITCNQLMRYMSKPTYGENNQLLDSGLDLNMEGGMGEHVKDIIILTSVTHVVSLLSNYCWLFLLLVPLRAFWLLWVNFLGPWFFQAAPDDTDQDDKKRKKMERRMKRQQQM